MANRTLIGALALLAACSKPAPLVSQPFGLKSGANNHLYIVQTDYSTGALRRLNLRTGTLDAAIFPPSPDALARWDAEGERLVLLNSSENNNLTLVSGDLKQPLRQIPLKPGVFPQDIALLGGGEAYVISRRSNRIDRWDLENGLLKNSVDISSFADADGFAEPAFFVREGERVWVTLQRLDSATSKPAGASKVLELDPQRDEVLNQIDLAFANPFAEFKLFEGFLWFAGVGSFESFSDGGLERLDLTERKTSQPIVSEGRFGGNLLGFEILRPDLAVAIAAGASTDLVFFDPLKRTVRKRVAGKGFQFRQLLADRERAVFYIADRESNPPCVQVRNYEGELLGTWAMDLPPFQLILAP